MSPDKDNKEKEREGAIMEFLHLLEEMDQKKETETSGFGELGEFDARVKYGYSLKLEPELKDFPLHSRRGFHRRKRSVSKKKR